MKILKERWVGFPARSENVLREQNKKTGYEVLLWLGGRARVTRDLHILKFPSASMEGALRFLISLPKCA